MASSSSSSGSSTSEHQLFSLKLDNIQRLSDSSSYQSWCGIAKLYFEKMGLLSIIDGSNVAPTDEAELKKWRGKDIDARLALAVLVDQSITNLVSDAPTAHGAWKALQDKYDRRNPTTLYHSVKSFFSDLQKTDDTTMLDHINHYEKTHRNLLDRCRDTASDDPYQSLAEYLQHDKI
jgi:hypothetical protein